MRSDMLVNMRRSISRSPNGKKLALGTLAIFLIWIFFGSKSNVKELASKSAEQKDHVKESSVKESNVKESRRGEKVPLNIERVALRDSSKEIEEGEMYRSLARDLEPMRRKLFAGKTRPFKFYQMNATHSDTLPIDRDIPDTRMEGCAAEHWDARLLPRASIIMPFYNEPWSMLLRSIHSALSRGPSILIHEFILVDDKSDVEYLGAPLEEYVRRLPKVRLIRTTERSGLMRARMFGAANATAEVLVFLDAHTEANEYWLAPLLNEIYKDANTAMMSELDNIDENLIGYTGDVLSRNRLIFDFKMQEMWAPVPQKVFDNRPRKTAPIPCPGMSGSVLAISRSMFYRLGGYDDGMNIWGGENVELAMRTWMCGGKLLVHPCSHVGHVFRSYMPYRIGVDTIQKNRIRVAELWLDGYRPYFYAATDQEAGYVRLTETEVASLRKRKEYIDSLQCKSFQWFLQNVAEDVYVPPPGVLFWGQIKNSVSSCWRFISTPDKGNFVSLSQCFVTEPLMFYYMRQDGVLETAGYCVTLTKDNYVTLSRKCPEDISRITWDFDAKTGQLRHRATGNFAVQVTRHDDDRYQAIQLSSSWDRISDKNFATWKFTFNMRFDNVQEKLIF